MRALVLADWMEAIAAAYVNRARYFERDAFVDVLVLMGMTAKENGWQPSQVCVRVCGTRVV